MVVECGWHCPWLDKALRTFLGTVISLEELYQIELRITDDRMDHGGQMSAVSELITVDNSAPRAVI